MALTFTQQLVFDAIDNDPGSDVADLADETGLPLGRVRQTLQRLEDRGLVLSLGSIIERRYVTRSGR